MNHYERTCNFMTTLTKHPSKAKDYVHQAWVRIKESGCSEAEANKIWAQTAKRLFYNDMRDAEVARKNTYDVECAFYVNRNKHADTETYLNTEKLLSLINSKYKKKSSRTDIRVLLAELNNEDRREAAKAAGLSYANYRVTLTRLRKLLRELV